MVLNVKYINFIIALLSNEFGDILQTSLESELNGCITIVINVSLFVEIELLPDACEFYVRPGWWATLQHTCTHRSFHLLPRSVVVKSIEQRCALLVDRYWTKTIHSLSVWIILSIYIGASVCECVCVCVCVCVW